MNHYLYKKARALWSSPIGTGSQWVAWWAAIRCSGLVKKHNKKTRQEPFSTLLDMGFIIPYSLITSLSRKSMRESITDYKKLCLPNLTADLIFLWVDLANYPDQLAYTLSVVVAVGAGYTAADLMVGNSRKIAAIGGLESSVNAFFFLLSLTISKKISSTHTTIIEPITIFFLTSTTSLLMSTLKQKQSNAEKSLLQNETIISTA